MNYESNDASLRVIAVAVGVLVFWVAGSLAAAAWFYQAHTRASVPNAGWARQTSFTNGPSQRTSIAQDVAAMDEETARHLGTYAWINRDAGIARIPIDRAMELLLQRGLPTRTEPSTRR